jgi:hypothetical protein
LESLEELAYFQSDLPNRTQLKSPHNALHFLVATACRVHNTRLSAGQRCVQDYIDEFSSKDNEPLEAAYVLQAQLFKLQGRTSDALDSIEKALLIKPDFKPALKEKQLILLLKP